MSCWQELNLLPLSYNSVLWSLAVLRVSRQQSTLRFSGDHAPSRGGHTIAFFVSAFYLFSCYFLLKRACCCYVASPQAMVFGFSLLRNGILFGWCNHIDSRKSVFVALSLHHVMGIRMGATPSIMAPFVLMLPTVAVLRPHSAWDHRTSGLAEEVSLVLGRFPGCQPDKPQEQVSVFPFFKLGQAARRIPNVGLPRL